MTRLLLPLSALILFAITGDALAQVAGDTGFNLSWAALDPGNDWAWQMIQSVFPVNGTPPTNTGTAATVVGQIVGQLTGFVMAIAMTYVCYTTIINIHRVSETSQILTNGMSSLFLVRLGFAGVMMFPLASGFSTGQAAVVQAAKWGIGMATAVYANAVQAIGPDAMVIATPQIPGTSTTVLNLMQDELCMALINQAAGSTLVPAPTATTVTTSNGGSITYAYSLAPGNGTGTSTCGTITIAEPLNSGANLAGVSIDMSAQQQQILQNILTAIRPSIQTIAANYWQSKNETALSPLQSLYTSTTQSYTQQLTADATNITASLRAALQSSQNARDGSVGLLQNENQLSALGWTSAAAYYLEFARLNGLTLSLLSGTPVVNMPSWEGLSPSLKSDIAPLFTASTSLLAKLRSYAQTTDGLQTPAANADTATIQNNSAAGSSTIEQIFRALNFTPALLSAIVGMITPTGNQWSDPFGGLVALGNELILVAMTALGLAAVASSTTGTAAAAAFNLLTLNWGAAALTVAANAIMQFVGPLVFTAALALLIPGLTIAFVLPMIPWVMWIAGVAGYLILVCEAVVAVPLWMLAHMTFEGEGLHGRGLAGYELIFNVLFRPTLMLLGLFLGYFVFTSMSWLIRMSFGIAAGFVLGNGWLVTNWLGLFVLLAIFVLTHVISALMSFQLISLIPHHLPKLIGFSSANRVDMDQFQRDAAYIGTGDALATINRGVTPKQLSQAGQSGQNQLGYSGQKLLGNPSGGTSSTSGTTSSQTGHMDTTLQATTGVSGSAPAQEG
ncbi:Conjugal transfer/type IV secretion protein DotA/TraY [Methylocella tundrae]|uniref:Conjugal transfer/type IV secretion protein DotA/TraY n=1 Tax=Methylocella tundrae TaxID=227605 RepID=A0A8B6M213_METTU|nr:DotA/TraY family protein [Methylocella tundrae]VTZ48804.1 Conjugal transfer/type IV secretion protein DotA/TraY [Methylocella tundrae]